MTTDEEYMHWTYESIKKGDRVTWTKKAFALNIPTKNRRELNGTVVKTDAWDGATYTVTVLWDGYKRPHRYAGAFITKVIILRRKMVKRKG